MIILDNKEREEMEDTGMCINCGREISPDMAQCEYCGYCYPSEIFIDEKKLKKGEENEKRSKRKNQK